MMPFLTLPIDKESIEKYQNLSIKELREKVKKLNSKLSKHSLLKTKKQLIEFLVSFEKYPQDYPQD
jgi:hypothetical protein